MTMLLLASVFASTGGCSEESRYRLLSIFFEDVPKLGEKHQWEPVVRRVRREPPARTPVPQVIVELPAEKPYHGREWLAELLPKLPKDKSGQPDMVKALNEKLIQPRPGIREDVKDQAPFSMDVVLEPKGMPAMKAVFSHKAHTQWLGCPNCHPGIFKMKKGSDPITMATIFAGKYCGACHGKVAFAVPTGCARCHKGMAGGKK